MPFFHTLLECLSSTGTKRKSFALSLKRDSFQCPSCTRQKARYDPWFLTLCHHSSPSPLHYQILPKCLLILTFLCFSPSACTQLPPSLLTYLGFPRASDCKEFACNARDRGLILGLGKSPGERNGYSLHYSCLENSMDRGTWQATVHEVAKSQTRLSD